ncbi:MAG: hypothetical protein ACI9VR_000804 [Cognaticolwellia sp.]|jgi:hypothetical protein
MSHILLLLGCFQSWTVTSDCTPVELFLDEDGDGFGSESQTACPGEHPVRYSADQGQDCDDTDALVNPGETEICDGLDNNCDGSVDEGVFIDFYVDADADGFGSGEPTGACADAPPFDSAATVGGDCEDSDAEVYPGADEACDGLDNDCDDSVDEDPVSGPTWYDDTDDDSYGDPGTAVVACTQPSGTVSDGTDCDDSQTQVYPGALEICGDGILNDCNGSADCRFSGSEFLTNWDLAFDTVVGEGLGSSLNTGDLSGDGVADLSAATSPDSSLGAVLVAFDLPSTANQTLFYHQVNNAGFGAHDLGDMTGDGQADLAVAAEDYGVAYLFEGPLDPSDSYVPQNQAQGTLNFPSQDTGQARILILGDIDGDGQPEMALSQGSDQIVTLFSGVWQEDDYEAEHILANLLSEESNFGLALETSDIDGDGLPELSVLNRKIAHIVNTTQISTGVLLEDCSSNLQSPGRFVDMGQAGDATGSGAQALWVSTASDEIGLWSGERSWSDLAVRLNLTSGYQLQGPVSGGQDMDGDGNLDLAFSVTDTFGESGVCLTYGPLLEGVLTPDYCATEKGSPDAGMDVLLTTDLNGDGVPDLATGDPSADGGNGSYYLLFGQSI